MTARSRGAPLTSVGQGRYELLGVLGEGGMASVWRANDTTTGDVVAVKLLHLEIAERRNHRSRFLAEARTMRRLNHPNVLRVWDVGEDDGRPWFTMDLVDGGALIDRLQTLGKLPPLEALDVAFQVLQALSVAHLASVVHRDVKPDNVLLGRDGSVRLSDFGIAQIRNDRVDHITGSGVAMGTVGYMSPEQRESARDVGPAADLYATGATLYASVTGWEPPDLYAAHLDPKLLDHVPPAIREVVRRATAYRPEKRYPNARAMAEGVARAHDAMARGMGLPEKLPEWLARFDRLIAESIPPGADTSAAPPADALPVRAAVVLFPILPLPTPAPAERRSVPRTSLLVIAGVAMVVILVVIVVVGAIAMS